MSKARELASLGNAYSDGALSNRNKIINGSFTVAQRGTNVNVTGGRIYGLDRWCSVGVNNAEVMSMQQVENTAYDLDFTHYMKHTKSTTDGCWVYQRLENVKQFSNKTLTLSYYAWVDSGTSSVTSGSWGRFNGVDENVSGYGGNVITVTTTPTKFVHTFTFADILATAGSASDFFELNWYRNTATNLNLANVQLEVGDTATPFEHRSYGQELALCQRFFERFYYPSGQNRPVALGHWYATNGVHAPFYYSEKRAAPTASVSNANHFGLYIGTSLDANYATTLNLVQLTSRCLNFNPSAIATGAVGTVNAAALISKMALYDAWIDIDAEL